MKASDELKELASELVAVCIKGTQSRSSYDNAFEHAARARAKGRLLLHKLGSFGAIWEKSFDLGSNAFTDLSTMLATASEMLDAIAKGRLSSIEERVSAAVLGDLVEHAEILIEQSYFLAAAVVLRAVLEERLRKLCKACTLPITAPKPTMEHFRQALAKADVIDKIVAKKIDWMAGVGNAAAHNLDSFNPSDVPDLYKATLDFLDRFAI